MTPRSIPLTPFPGTDVPPDIRITGTIGRRGNSLSVGFKILGKLAEIALPLPADNPGRRDRLWEETCLELFLGETGAGPYWEFNLSPAGHWNVYRFASYRKGMREENAFSSLPFRTAAEPEAFRLSLGLDLGRILPEGVTARAALCAVVKTVDGRTSHWAPVHPGPRPDFHRKDGFNLKIPAG